MGEGAEVREMLNKRYKFSVRQADYIQRVYYTTWKL
jgi:hypothetical protein